MTREAKRPYTVFVLGVYDSKSPPKSFTGWKNIKLNLVSKLHRVQALHNPHYKSGRHRYREIEDNIC